MNGPAPTLPLTPAPAPAPALCGNVFATLWARLKKPNGDDKKILLAAGLILLVPLLVIATADDVATRLWLVREDGPVETLSWMGYAACLLYALCRGGLAYLRAHWRSSACILLMGLRELDIDKQFTAMSILKARYYSSADIAIGSKIVAALVLAAILYVVAGVIARQCRPFLRGLCGLGNVELCVLAGLGLTFASKMVDGLGRKLLPLGVKITQAQADMAEIGEEFMELGIPLMFLLALYFYFRNRRAAL